MSLVRASIAVALLATCALGARCAAAATPGAFTPRVPVSGLAWPWTDPQGLHVSTSFSVGSGFGGRGTSALQLTSFSWQFAAPLRVAVSLGNSWGGSGYASNHAFLEGLQLDYRPSPALQFQISYRDLRSPLQLSQSPFGFSRYAPLP